LLDCGKSGSGKGWARHFRRRLAMAGQAVRADVRSLAKEAADSRRRAVAALWRAAKAEGLPSPTCPDVSISM